ncbi:hypothetical protein K438DRAFT_1956140 [Mycena galopus ATCC 62051]|nr:hypothetical protein K438DRAFT_1956140 [Mycena galopus ATCC 62051]
MSARLRRRLAELDAQIVNQRRVLDELQQTRSDVERELHATATYPILTLPTEITTENFLICREWRDIAIATPTLWSKLKVHFDDIAQDILLEPGLVEGMVDRWLAYAGTSLRSLEFRCRGELFSLSRLRALVHRWSHRVQYLSLDTGYRSIHSLDLNSAMFPLLHRAALGYDHSDDPITVFSTAPRFHDLCLLSGHRLGVLAPPWLQLTKFTGPLHNRFVFIALNLTNIRCEFNHHGGASTATTHGGLKCFILDHYSEDILQYLTLPALQYLDISFNSARDKSFPSFLARSSPPLVSLSVKCVWEGLGASTRLVASTLDIIEFDYDHDNTSPSIFKVLNSILPNLPSIIVRELYGSLDLVDLMIFLYPRCNTLRTFKLVWTGSPFFDARISLRHDQRSPFVVETERHGYIYTLGLQKNYAAIGGNTSTRF